MNWQHYPMDRQILMDTKDKEKKMKKLKIAICDDESYYLSHLKELVIQYMDKTNMEYEVDLFSSGENFLVLGEKIGDYDILFLDINMREKTGFDTAREYRKYAPHKFLIFVTAYIEYAPDGYPLNAFRFLLKNSLDDMFRECMDTLCRKIVQRCRTIEVPFREGKERVLVSELCSIESREHLLYFRFFSGSVYTLYGKLDEWEEELKDQNFLRIHKSFLINSRDVRRIRHYKVVLRSGKELSVSKVRYRQVLSQFQKWKNEKTEN